MTSMPSKEETELEVLELLDRHDVPRPDRVEYCEACIRLFWEESKVVFIVDLE